MRIGKKDIFALGLLLLAVLVFFFRFLDGREVFAFKDLSRYFYPLRQLMADQVRSGHLPLWNPYIYFGMPLMAGLQVGFFYPLTVIYYLLTFDLAFNYYIVVHYFMAAGFMYLFMRHLDVSRSASFVSAMLFAFSGYLLSVSNMNTSLTSVVWLPLVLLFWDRFVNTDPLYNPPLTKGGPACSPRGEAGRQAGMSRRGRGGTNFICLIIFLSLMFLGGEPTIIYVAGFVLLLWGLVFAEGKNNKLFSVGALLFAFAAMCALTAVQLIPFLELSSLSNRMTITQFKWISMRSFPPREIIGFIFPYFYGNQLLAGNYSPMLLGKILQDWLISPYLGLLPFVLLFFSFWGKFKKVSVFFAVSALASLFMAFGHYTPVYYVVYKLLPGISVIRYPVKYIFLLTFALAAMAGIGLDNIVKDERAAKRASILLWSLCGTLAVLFTVSFVFKKQLFLFILSRYGKLPGYFINVLWHNLNFNINSLLYLAAMLLICALILSLMIRKIVRTRIFLIIIAGVIFFDLLSNNAPLSPASDPSVYHGLTPNVAIIKEGAGTNRYFYSNELEKHNRATYGPDYDQALIESLDKLTSNRLMPYKLQDTYGYESIELQEYMEFYDAALKNDFRKNIKILNLTGNKYIADIKPINGLGLKLKKASEYYVGKVYLYENPNRLPRAFIVPGYIRAFNRQQALSIMLDRRFNIKKKIVLEEDVNMVFGTGAASADIIKYEPNEVRIRAKLEKPGFLFLSDAYYPGWRAYVDGKEAKIVRANYMFRAVYLLAGDHSVRFSYEPASLLFGAVISLLTSVILGISIIVGMLKRKNG